MTRDKFQCSRSIFVVLYISILLSNSFSIETSSFRGGIVESQVEENEKQRPKMHTYFIEVSKKPEPEYELLEAWKEAWSDAGWEPIVLGPEDAMRNPNYQRFIDAFENAPYEVRDYDRACFLRWLAMGASNGGWMSDYDTFPLYSHPQRDGFNLPNHGKFTSYSRHVPNLVSGSVNEWNRMSDLLYFSYEMHHDKFWSDMLALQELHDVINGYEYQSDSTALERIYARELKETGKIERPYALGAKCEELLGNRVIHFSHADCDRVSFCHRDRKLAKKWIQQWKEKCKIDT